MIARRALRASTLAASNRRRKLQIATAVLALCVVGAAATLIGNVIITPPSLEHKARRIARDVRQGKHITISDVQVLLGLPVVTDPAQRTQSYLLGDDGTYMAMDYLWLHIEYSPDERVTNALVAPD